VRSYFYHHVAILPPIYGFRKEFATTNETNLRQQLTEFFDHRVIQEDQKSGGILLTVSKEVLVSFLEGKQGSEGLEE